MYACRPAHASERIVHREFSVHLCRTLRVRARVGIQCRTLRIGEDQSHRLELFGLQGSDDRILQRYER